MKYAALIRNLENVMDEARNMEALSSVEQDSLVDHIHEILLLLDKTT